MKEILNKLFDDVREKSFVNGEGFTVRTDKCKAVIAIRDDEIIMSEIFSYQKGGGSDMLNKLEDVSKFKNKDFVIANIISPKLYKMVKKRDYVREVRPFAPEHGMHDPVELYKKVV